MAETDETVWSLGYGSNMNIRNLEFKKHVKVIENTPAVLKDHRMAFNIKGGHHVETAFSGLVPSPGSEVHGLAIKMDTENMNILDRSEGFGAGGYLKKWVTFHAYDGRELEGFVYMNKRPGPSPEYLPSTRYMGILVRGAKLAGLHPDYVKMLETHPVYTPNEATLKARRERPALESLPEITLEQLSDRKDCVSCLGYVMLADEGRLSHRGRDITTRALINYHGVSLDDYDDGGIPPYPLVKDFTEEELEYVTEWLDRYSLNADDSPKHSFIGYLKEFKEQQESGTTDFVMPPIP